MNNGEPINNTEIIKTGVEFPKALLKLVQKRVIDRDLKMKDAVREAFTMWLAAIPANEGSTHPPSVIKEIPDSNTGTAGVTSLSSDLAEIKDKLDTVVNFIEGMRHGETNDNFFKRTSDFKEGLDRLHTLLARFEQREGSGAAPGKARRK